MTTEIIIGLYDNYSNAAQSVREIEALGVPREDMSVIASNIANHIDDRYMATEKSNVGPDAAVGAGVGAVLGGGTGVLAGLGLIAIPGVGPVVAAGWLVAMAVGTVAGAGVGGAAGGIVGSLASSGVSTEHAHVYAEGIRRGGTLVTVRVDQNQVAAVEEIMRCNRAVDPELRGRTYREAGWKSFDDPAQSYTESQLVQERKRTRDRMADTPV
jgi:hypothetical protein